MNPATPAIRFAGRIRSALLLAAVLATAGCGDDSVGPGGKVEVTVMSRNIYLGANVFQLATAGSGSEVPAVAGQLYANMVATDFRVRARALAAEIRATNPALIGLQEVSLYRTQSPSDFFSNPVVNAQDTTYDFLGILLAELQANGLGYRVAAKVANVDAELPAALDPGSRTLTDVRLTDYDVILARSDVETSGVVERNFAVSAFVTVGGSLSVPFTRGWVKVDAVVDGAKLTFVNSHVEGQPPGSSMDVNRQQATALARATRPFDEPVILVGDINSKPDGTGTPAYGIFTGEGFVDAWSSASSAPGLTCCFREMLTNPDDELYERIDVVFYRGAGVEVVSAEVVGDERADRISGLWPSDHAGVVVTFRIPR